MSMTYQTLALLLLVTLGNSMIPVKGIQNASKCVSLFSSYKSGFEICKKNPCFVFRAEKPYVIMNSSMREPADQAPFPCDQHEKLWPGLSGAFFAIVKRLNGTNAYCVWGGADCTFNDMVQFVGEVSKKERHKFAVGGLMFLLAYRVTEHTIPSAPLLDDHLVVLGPRQNREEASKAFKVMWEPFTIEAWIFLITILIVLLMGRVLNNVYFTIPFTWSNFTANLFGDYDAVTPQTKKEEIQTCDSPGCFVGASPSCIACRKFRTETDDQSERNVQMRTLNANLAKALSIFSFIAILFYEIAIVNFLFNRSASQVSEFQHQKFIIVKDTTQEHNFRKMMQNQGFNTPWMRGNDFEEVHEKLLSSNEPLYTLEYMKFSQYFLTSKENKRRLEVYDMHRPLPVFPGVWYFGSRINITERTKIDKDIAYLREQGLITEILSNLVGDSELDACKSRETVGFVTLSLPVLMFVGPFILYTIYTVILIVKRNLARRDHIPD